jgi:hypothetical protein
LLLLKLATVPLQDAIRVVIWVEALSIGFWAGLAAWLIGLRGRPLMLAVLAGLVVSAVVLGLQVILQPGKAVEGGEAAGPRPRQAHLVGDPLARNESVPEGHDVRALR